MQVLGISLEEISLLRQIRAKKGILPWALSYLGIESMEQLKDYLKWIKLSKAQKLELLIYPIQSIRDFFNATYLHYRRFKKKNQDLLKNFLFGLQVVGRNF